MVEESELRPLVSNTILERILLVEKEIFATNKISASLTLSSQFRNNFDWTASTLCYNEIAFGSFLKLILGLKDFDIGFDEDATFVDVGCGIGKTIIMMAILNSFKRAIGIDICDDLHKKCLDNVKSFSSKFRSPLDQIEIEVLQGDGTFWDWSFADLVFIQTCCYNNEMLQRVTNVANNMKAGAVIIIIGRRLTDEAYFDLMGTTKVEYLFGEIVAFIYKKNSKGFGKDSESLRLRLHQIFRKQYL